MTWLLPCHSDRAGHHGAAFLARPVAWLRWDRMSALEREALEALHTTHLRGRAPRNLWDRTVRVVHGLLEPWVPSDRWVTTTGLVIGAVLLQVANDTFGTIDGTLVPTAPMVAVYGVGLVALAASRLRVLGPAKALMVRVALLVLTASVAADGVLLPLTVRYGDHGSTQAAGLAAAGAAYAVTMAWLALSIVRAVLRRDRDLDRTVSPLVAVAVADLLWAVTEAYAGNVVSAAGSALSGVAVMVLSVVATGVEIGGPADDGDTYEDIRPRSPQRL